MNTETVKQAKSAGEARQHAMDWQAWAYEQSLSYGELAEWQHVFMELATKYDLVKEFEENGII